MKVITVNTQNENITAESLFFEGIEMAKREVSTNLWYNMNIKRIQRLVSFCMDYLRYQKEGCIDTEEDTEGCCTTFTCYS